MSDEPVGLIDRIESWLERHRIAAWSKPIAPEHEAYYLLRDCRRVFANAYVIVDKEPPDAE